MAVFETYRTARRDRPCDFCKRGIKAGERYKRSAATPHDYEVNQGEHWWVLNICREHMIPESEAVKDTP